MVKGFTLIELLAVIVILAIIALIATPIVLSIIEDSKSSSILRSADFYLDGLELSIANSILENKNITDGTYEIMSDGNICLEYDSDNKCINILEVEVDGEMPNSGKITILNGQITVMILKLDNKTIINNEKGELVYSPCKLVEDNGNKGITAGDVYNCKVDPNKEEYKFYVLGINEDGTTNLIMDQNINSDGTKAGMIGVLKDGENVYNLVTWNNEIGQKSSLYGPVTAMNFLYKATKNWTNVPALNYAYYDREVQEITDETVGYESFISNKGILTITGKVITTIGTKEIPLRARMPIYSPDSTKREIAAKTKNNAYLYDNLDLDNLSALLRGYWALSSYKKHVTEAWYVSFYGGVNAAYMYGESPHIGVRPVITLGV